MNQQLKTGTRISITRIMRPLAQQMEKTQIDMTGRVIWTGKEKFQLATDCGRLYYIAYDDSYEVLGDAEAASA